MIRALSLTSNCSKNSNQVNHSIDQSYLNTYLKTLYDLQKTKNVCKITITAFWVTMAKDENSEEVKPFIKL